MRKRLWWFLIGILFTIIILGFAYLLAGGTDLTSRESALASVMMTLISLVASLSFSQVAALSARKNFANSILSNSNMLKEQIDAQLNTVKTIIEKLHQNESVQEDENTSIFLAGIGDNMEILENHISTLAKNLDIVVSNIANEKT